MNKQTILLIEDNAKINLINRRELVAEGYRVLTAGTLEEGRKQLHQEEPDLIILDIMMPDGDGIEFCRSLRGDSNVPVIFLSARKKPESVVEGLRAGGDDYMTKPYRLKEMLARVEAILRRNKINRQKQACLRMGELELNIIARRAYYEGQDLMLQSKEYALLELLVYHQGELLDKDTIYQRIWDQPIAGDSQALYISVSRLKKKLKPLIEKGYVLESRRGDGYRLYYPGVK